MKLHLLRHAKTERHADSMQDFDRKLVLRGVEQSKDMAKYLENKVAGLDCFCSDATRTQETYHYLSERIKMGQLHLRHELYLTSYRDYLALLWRNNEKKDLLLIGHNFGISDLAGYLIDEEVELRTCEYMCIEFDVEEWLHTSRATGSLIDHYRPSF